MTNELNPDWVGVWKRLAELGDTIATAQAEEKDLKAVLRERLQAGTYTSDGEPVLRISTARTFDAKAAFRTLPPEVAVACVRTEPDPKLVRAQFSDVAAEQFMADGTPRVALL